MTWKKRKYFGQNANYSLIKKLREEKKITEEFEVMLNHLSLEEIIGLKLETATKLFGGKMYNIPIWKSLKYIVQDALLKYAYSAARTKKEAARLLDLSPKDFRTLIKKYDIDNYFEKKD